MDSPLPKKTAELFKKLKKSGVNRGGGADTGRRGELKSKLGVAINKIKRNRPTRPDIKKIKQKFQSEKDLPRAMKIDTTTSAYGDAGKGRPVPKYETGGPAAKTNRAILYLKQLLKKTRSSGNLSKVEQNNISKIEG